MISVEVLKNDTYSYKFRIFAREPGITTVTLTDTETGAVLSFPVTVTERLNVLKFNEVPKRYDLEKGKETNFYNINGIFVEGFKYS